MFLSTLLLGTVVALGSLVFGLRDVSDVQRIYDVTHRVKPPLCCDVCLCRSDIVSCVGRHLLQVPDQIPDSVQQLDLRDNRITVLPRKVISGLINLTRVSLSRNELQALHSQAFLDLPALVSLDLSHNQLDNVGLDLSSSTALEHLDLSWNRLTSVIDVASIRNAGLKSLNLSHNLFKAPRLNFEPSFANFTALETLDLGGNVFMSLVTTSLHHLPASVTNLSLAKCDIIDADENSFAIAGTHLREIDLSGNFLSINELKEIFRNMPNNTVETLRLRHMDLQEVVPDPCFPGWTWLTYVDYSDNKIEIVSDIAFQGTNIEVLNLANNQLTSSSINLMSANLPRLHTLILAENQFDSVPSLELDALRHLDVSRNQIRDINVTTLRAGSLRTLVISHNQIEIVDTKVFNEFVHIEHLDVSHNHVTSFNLGTSVGRRLRSLRLDHNKLESLLLDETQRRLHLEVLDIGFNRFRNLSRSLFRRMPKLRTLSLAGNRHLFRPHATQSISDIRNLDVLDLSDLDLVSLKKLRLRNLCVENLVLANNAFNSTSALDVAERCLRSADLSTNVLREVNVTFLEKFPHLVEVNLAHNPFVCDCNIRKFYSWIRNSDVTIRDYDVVNAYACVDPQPVRGLPLWAERKHLLEDCSTWTLSRRGLYVTFALTAIALSAILVTLIVTRDTLFSCKRSRLLTSKLYASCSEKVRTWRESTPVYPHLFSPSVVGLARSASGGGYHHLDTATDTTC